MSSPDPQPPTFTPALFEGGFESYLRAVRRHPFMVVIVTLAAVAGAGVWLKVRTPDYRATSQVIVTPMPFDDSTYSGLPVVKDTPGDPTRGVQTAAALINTPSAAGAAARTLGPGWTEGRVRAALTVIPIGGTNVVAVQATARHPALAVRIAQAFSSAAVSQRRASLAAQANALVAQLKTSPGYDPVRIDALIGVARGFDPTFSLLQQPSTPTATAGPAPWRIIASALFAGLVLGVGAALLTDALGRRSRAAGSDDADSQSQPPGTVHELSRR